MSGNKKAPDELRAMSSAASLDNSRQRQSTIKTEPRQVSSNYARVVPGTIAYDAIVDCLIEQGQTRRVALVGALVFGAVFRFAAMDPTGVCQQTQKVISENAQCAWRTFQDHIKYLVDFGLVDDKDAGKRGGPHRYAITDLAFTVIDGETESYTGDVFKSTGDVELGPHEDEEEEKYLTLKNSIKKLDAWERDFGRPSPGYIDQFQEWVDDPGVEIEWINQMIREAIATRPDNPERYGLTVMADYKVNNGPKPPKPRTRSRSRAVQVEKPPAGGPPQTISEASKVAQALPLPAEPPPDAWAEVLELLDKQPTRDIFRDLLRGSEARRKGEILVVEVLSERAVAFLPKPGNRRPVLDNAKVVYGEDLLEVEFCLSELPLAV